MVRRRWRQTLDSLVKDTRLDGQGYLFEVAVLLADLVGDSVPVSRSSYLAWLVERCRRLVGAGRERAAVFRLVNGMLWALDDAPTPEMMRTLALGYLHGLGARRAEMLEKLASAASHDLSRYRRIMTYGRDTALLQALIVAAARRESPEVVLSEGRPRLEGLTMASELAWGGVEVTLGVDMALFGWLADVQALFLGAESLSVRGLLYRRGTAALVEAAQVREVPVYVICGRDDFTPAEYPIAGEALSGPFEEITPDAHERITVRNIAWDLTPLESITAAITAEGMLAGDALEQALGAVRAHPALVGR